MADASLSYLSFTSQELAALDTFFSISAQAFTLGQPPVLTETFAKHLVSMIRLSSAAVMRVYADVDHSAFSASVDQLSRWLRYGA